MTQPLYRGRAIYRAGLLLYICDGSVAAVFSITRTETKRHKDTTCSNYPILYRTWLDIWRNEGQIMENSLSGIR